MKNLLLIAVICFTTSCIAQRDFKNLTEKDGKIQKVIKRFIYW